jgi:hypothetical protein
MAEAKFYVYVHREADTGLVFYVGKGSERRAWASQWRPEFWHRVSAKHGRVVEIVAMFWDEEPAFEHERTLIAEYRAQGLRLTNCTDGGDGPSGAKRSESTRRKMSEARRRRTDKIVWSDEAKERQRQNRLGKKMSPEAIAKTVAAHLGSKRSPETLARMSASLKGKNVGRVKTPEEIAKIVAANKGRTISAEQRAKQSAAMRGRKLGPQTPEQIAKRKASFAKTIAERRARARLAANRSD